MRSTPRSRCLRAFLWPLLGFDRVAPETPVLIARDCEVLPHDQVLLNLAPDSPVSFTRFQRLIELVASDDADKQAGRARFRFYRDRGYEIHHHDLRRTGS